MRTRDVNTLATRRRILDVCQELFRTRGFDGATIDEIIDRASVSRQTFFNHFPKKQAAATALWLAWLDDQAAVPPADPDPAVPGGVLPAMRAAVIHQAKTVESDRDYMALLFANAGGFPGPADENARLGVETRDRSERIFERVAGVIAAAQHSGEVREDIDPRRAAELYVSAMLMTIRLWLNDGAAAADSLAHRMATAIDLLEGGIGTTGDHGSKAHQ